MKKVIILVMLLSLIIGTGNIKANNTNEPKTEMASSPSKLSNEEAQKLISRLNEIKDLDKSKLTRKEKKSLKKEVLSIKKQLDQKQEVIYISLTVILLIVLLIILL